MKLDSLMPTSPCPGLLLWVPDSRVQRPVLGRHRRNTGGLTHPINTPKEGGRQKNGEDGEEGDREQDRETHPHRGLKFQWLWKQRESQKDGGVRGKGKRERRRVLRAGEQMHCAQFQAQVPGLSTVQRGLTC